MEVTPTTVSTTGYFYISMRSSATTKPILKYSRKSITTHTENTDIMMMYRDSLERLSKASVSNSQMNNIKKWVC